MEKVTRIRFMFQTRSLSTGFLVASLGLAAGFAVLGSPNLASADAGCDKLKVKAVKDVCTANGGVAGVKKSMKAAMDKANTDDKAGLKCESCHTNATDYPTKPDAEKGFNDKLAKYFAAPAK
jgi:hypothetical protein